MEQVEVARWRLTAPHYLSAMVRGGPVEWEHSETDRDTGRQNRKRFVVPVYLDPNNPGDYNYPGEIIVANGPYNRDIVFQGPPTIDMEPLNSAAEALSAEQAKKGQHPIDSLPGQGVSYSEQVLQQFTRQLEAVMAKTPIPQMDPVSAGAVSAEQFAEMQKQMQTLMEQNAQLMDKVYGKDQPEAGEPLDEHEPATRRA